LHVGAAAISYGAKPILITSDSVSYGAIAMHRRNRYPGRPDHGRSLPIQASASP